MGQILVYVFSHAAADGRVAGAEDDAGTSGPDRRPHRRFFSFVHPAVSLQQFRSKHRQTHPSTETEGKQMSTSTPLNPPQPAEPEHQPDAAVSASSRRNDAVKPRRPRAANVIPIAAVAALVIAWA